ncbi:FKBP-type peptidyl-prolyl cis-trans isomerase [Sphingomonas naphthae]|uniref:Peptidyl-prolyl cis-trans isomerase n=1 Tax=Sphingomonas naphthae TaxID=1813468 RepID=A0ABY7TNW7_9SPHN|nr:FKBP-type peptidyl-prolyl cis-trans isomerase [Sphingomonas naphthae]WCT73904.1 FKBP-type peptidyl-prolyl cis-trans isomerase [Sphingomonas naphthae]
MTKAMFGLMIAGLAALAVPGAAVAAKAKKPPVGKVILPPLSYTIDKSGPVTGEHPKRADTILANYSLTLLDGTVIDSSYERGEPSSFPLGRLIPAWQILIQLMRPGDAWTFYVPPEYGYGAVARDKLPANSFLIFKVELVSVTPAG